MFSLSSDPPDQIIRCVCVCVSNSEDTPEYSCSYACTTDWKLIKTEDGYSVYRKFLGMGPSSQYACVMCNGVINAPAKDVLSLFEDNTR